ncbi:hypothetical protein ANG5_0381 [Streptococcus constellatus subsp. pharyngis SK1060 = CCUG 46377]|uniref:Uncharacterized protein n=1 Tax=Streptococcus constellatus subsp. pharyngis SK1060 = CCUG 46377 TaxID=1035184 RepID=U2ZMX5_STRCV|nr:hypothetical protein ANG5_0381 [Streptococcus constellatus subsp. pharyngis SK1060 = CCUG 46377]
MHCDSWLLCSVRSECHVSGVNNVAKRLFDTIFSPIKPWLKYVKYIFCVLKFTNNALEHSRKYMF